MMSERTCQAWAATHVGYVRCGNEDVCAVPGWISGPGAESWGGLLAADGGWALVADGMGGQAAGEVASRRAVETLAPLMPVVRDSLAVGSALAVANAALYRAMAADPALAGMGTTIAGIVLAGASVLTFNLGDSRIYTVAGDAPVRLSIDHSVGHALTQCLGGTAEPVPLDPHCASARWRKGGRLLLCSDGLTNMLPDAAIGACLAAAGSADPAEALVAAALGAGGIDNITAIVVAAPG